jgi:hypothetical protein
MIVQSLGDLPVKEIGASGQYWRIDLHSLNSRLDIYAYRIYLPTVLCLFLGVIKPIGFLFAPLLGLLGWLAIQCIRRKSRYVVIDLARRVFSFYRGALREGQDSLLKEIHFDDCVELSSKFDNLLADNLLAEQVLSVRTKSGETQVLTRFQNIKKSEKWTEHLYPSGEHPLNAKLRIWMSQKSDIRDGGFVALKG